MYYFNNIWIKCIINLVQFYVRKWDDFLYDDNQVNNGAPYTREQIQINVNLMLKQRNFYCVLMHYAIWACFHFVVHTCT